MAAAVGDEVAELEIELEEVEVVEVDGTEIEEVSCEGPELLLEMLGEETVKVGTKELADVVGLEELEKLANSSAVVGLLDNEAASTELAVVDGDEEGTTLRIAVNPC